MKILVDAMGGDNAPLCVLQGAADALREFGDGMQLVLLGRKEVIEQTAKDNGIPLDGMELVDCRQVVTMHDDPVKAARKMTDSSLVRGLTMLKKRRGRRFCQRRLHRRDARGRQPDRPYRQGGQAPGAGHPHARLQAELPAFGLRRQRGVPRHDPQRLCGHGQRLCEKVMGRHSPSVALVNNGAEDTKGTPIYREAHGLMRANPVIRFAGNIEPRDVPNGEVDVVVCDGFVGNVILKLTEGVAKSLLGMLKDVFMQSVVTKLCYLGVKGGLRTIKHKMDSEEVGGAPLLGTARPVIKAHGSSKAKGIKNAIRQARLCVEGDLCGTMEAALAELQTDETRAEKSE